MYQSVLDIRSLANLLQQSETACMSESAALNADASLYKEFCDHLDELESRKRLLIKPYSAIAEQGEHEKLLDNEPEVEYSMKESIKPLIEEIFEDPANSNKIEQILEQNERKSHDSQNASDYNQQDVSI